MEMATGDAGSSFDGGSYSTAERQQGRNGHRPTVHNVADMERVASVALGAALVTLGLRRRDLGGVVAALIGGALVHRGASGHCYIYERLGMSTGDAEAVLDAPRKDVTSRAATVNARKAIKVERSIIVNAPRSALYAFWRRFENLPHFMDHLESVTETSSTRSHWKAKAPAGTSVEWDAELVNDIPDTLIAWKTVGHPDVSNAGSVHFDAAGEGSTRVRVVLDYEPPAGRAGQMVAHLFGEEPDQQVEDDLARFKEFVESGGMNQPAE
jgi:uncharacterized membrane protein